MPTLGEALAARKSAGTLDALTAKLAGHGIDPFKFDQNMDLSDFAKRVKTIRTVRGAASQSLSALTAPSEGQPRTPPPTSATPQQAQPKQLPAGYWRQQNIDRTLGEHPLVDPMALSHRPAPPAEFFTGMAAGALKGIPTPSELVARYGPQVLSLLVGGDAKTLRLADKMAKETYGQQVQRELIEPRKDLPLQETAQKDVADQWSGMKAIARGMAGMDPPFESGQQLGQAATVGIIGATEGTLRDPVGMAHAAPFSTALTMLPAARATGMAARAARKAMPKPKTRAGTWAYRGAEFAEDVLDPIDPKKRQRDPSRTIEDSDLPEVRQEAQAIEDAYIEGRIDEAQRDALLDKLPATEEARATISAERVDSPGSKVGRAARRAIGGAAILGDPMSAMLGPAGGLIASAALPALAPPAMQAALRGAAALSDRTPEQIGSFVKRGFAQAGSQPTPAQTAVVGEALYDPLHARMRIQGRGAELAGRVEKGLAQADEAVIPGETPVPKMERVLDIGRYIDPKTGRISDAPAAATRRGAMSEAQRRASTEARSAASLAKESAKNLREEAGVFDRSNALGSFLKQPQKVRPLIRKYIKAYQALWRDGSYVQGGVRKPRSLLRAEDDLRRAQAAGDSRKVSRLKTRIEGLKRAQTLLAKWDEVVEAGTSPEFLQNLKDTAEDVVRAWRQEQVLRGLPRTERGLRLSSGELNVIERMQMEFVTGRDKALVAAIAAEIAENLPKSPLGDAARLESLFADAIREASVTRMLSVRNRAAVTEALARRLLEGDPKFPMGGDPKKTMMSRFEDSKTMQSIAAGEGVTPRVIAERLVKMGAKARKQALRRMIDKHIRDHINTSTIAGGIRDMNIRIPGGKDVRVSELGGEFWSSLPEAERRKVSAQAVKSLGEGVARHVQEAATVEAAYRELRRGMVKARKGMVGPDEDAFQALSVAVRGEMPPNLVSIPGDLKDFVSSAINNLEETTARVNARLPKGQRVQPSQVFQALEEMEGYKPVGDALGKAMSERAGQSRISLGDNKLYGRPGYVDSVGTTFDYLRAMKDFGFFARMFQHAKVALTAGSMKTWLNNIGSNGVMIAAMTGRSLPEVYAGMARELNEHYKHIKGLDSGRDRQITQALMDTGIADSSMIVDLVEGAFQGDPATGRTAKAWRDSWAILKDGYRMGDSIPKMYLSRRMFKVIDDDLRALEPGRTVRLDVGNGRVITVTAEAGGSFKVRDKAGRPTQMQIGTEPLDRVIAKAAIRAAADTLFDFNDLPQFVKKLGASRNVFNAFNPFAAWAFKAMELPGKKGLVGHMLSFDPSTRYITDSPILAARRAKRMGALSLRRGALAAVNQSMARQQGSGLLKDLYGYGGANAAMRMDLEAPEDEDRYNISYGDDPAVMADAQWRALQLGLTGIGDFFGLNRYGKLAQQQRSKDGKPLTTQERRLLALNSKLRAGKIASHRDVAALFGYTGGIFSRAGEAFAEGNLTKGAVAATGLVLGGTAAAGLDAAVAAARPADSAMHGRRTLRKPGGGRYESLEGYVLNRIIGLGYREAVKGHRRAKFLKSLHPTRGFFAREATKDLLKKYENLVSVGNKEEAAKVREQIKRIRAEFAVAFNYYKNRIDLDRKRLEQLRMDKKRKR